MEAKMLKETYLAKKKFLPKNAVAIVVTRTAKSILAPSSQLLEDWKNGRITWSNYSSRFRKEIFSNPDAIAKLTELKQLSKTKDVYLICYEKEPPCHRFLLLDFINEI